MGRPDGRIEKGQSLNRAISARAWNRAQDAADVVLGVRPGMEVDSRLSGLSRLVFPVSIPGGTSFPYAVVKIIGAAPGLNTSVQSSPYSQPPHATGAALPGYATGETYSGAAGSPWCICEQRLADQNSSAAYCVFRGITFARVRVRSASHKYAEPSIARDVNGAFPQIAGVLDSTECECEGAAKILAIGGTSVNVVYWAMILL